MTNHAAYLVDPAALVPRAECPVCPWRFASTSLAEVDAAIDAHRASPNLPRRPPMTPDTRPTAFRLTRAHAGRYTSHGGRFVYTRNDHRGGVNWTVCTTDGTSPFLRSPVHPAPSALRYTLDDLRGTVQAALEREAEAEARAKVYAASSLREQRAATGGAR